MGGDPVDRRLIQRPPAAVQKRLAEQRGALGGRSGVTGADRGIELDDVAPLLGRAVAQGPPLGVAVVRQPRHALFGVLPNPRERSIRRQSERENPASISGNRFFM